MLGSCFNVNFSNCLCTGGELAQMVERPLRMREVPGSIPGFSKFSFYYNKVKVLFVVLVLF